MPDIYFNPYTDAAPTIDGGINALTKTASCLRGIRPEIDTPVNPTADTPIGNYIVIREANSKAQHYIGSLIPKIQGKDRDLVRWFLSLFSKGKILPIEKLAICKDWCLENLEAPAPVLEYAARNDGMAATIATDILWECDFIMLEKGKGNVPNVWGQPELAPVYKWIEGWKDRNLTHAKRLKDDFDATICKGAFNDFAPNKSEWPRIFEQLQKGRETNYTIDNDLIKNVGTASGRILKELRCYGDGLRIFFVNNKKEITLGGFYRKGQGSSKKLEKLVQNKHIEKAKTRIERL